MAESNLKGMVVAEAPGADHAIAMLPSSACAFVGRTLRGPVNRPVSVHSFAEYQQVFGGLWQPSRCPTPSSSSSRTAAARVVVRVVQRRRAGHHHAALRRRVAHARGASPGSREVLRASVDYDNIGANEDDRFNLVVQRVRSAGSEHIEDQEIFRRLSIVPGTTRFVASALQESMLVRVRGDVPPRVPTGPIAPARAIPIGYVDSNPDGDDGAPLTDYDLIGSAGARHRPVRAAQPSTTLHFLCIPPPARDRDVGPGVLLAARRSSAASGARC